MIKYLDKSYLRGKNLLWLTAQGGQSIMEGKSQLETADDIVFTLKKLLVCHSPLIQSGIPARKRYCAQWVDLPTMKTSKSIPVDDPRSVSHVTLGFVRLTVSTNNHTTSNLGTIILVSR